MLGVQEKEGTWLGLLITCRVTLGMLWFLSGPHSLPQHTQTHTLRLNCHFQALMHQVMLVHLGKVVKMGSGKCWFQACLCSLLLWSPDKLQSVSELRAPQPFFVRAQM